VAAQEKEAAGNREERIAREKRGVKRKLLESATALAKKQASDNKVAQQVEGKSKGHGSGLG
jgi:hypothetical protein